MMTYETFKEELLKEVTMELSARGLSYAAELDFVNKTNIGYDAIRFSPRKEESTNCSGQVTTPLIPIERFFTAYSNGMSTCKACAVAVVDFLTEELDRVTSMSRLDISTMLDNVFPTLVSTTANAELLEDVVHREWLDLSIIYRWDVSDCLTGVKATARVTPAMLERADVTEEELHKCAMENICTREDFACKATSMMDVMMDMMGIVDEEEKELFMSDMCPADKVMYVLRNSDMAYASYAMLDTNLLDELATKLEDDLIILPSSIHEVIVIPRRGNENVSSLATMVSDINGSQVSEDERLSYSIYTYNRETKEVSIAS